jgi:hypothetical protein
MCYSIFTDKCQVVTRTTVSRVTNLEKRVNLNWTLMAKFDNAVYNRLHDSKYTIIGLDEPIAWQQLADLDDPEYIAEHDKVFNNETVPEADSIAYTPDSVGDPYLNTEVALSVGPDEEPMVGRVVKRLKDNDGQPIGHANDDPRLDTCMYEVEYRDGSTDALAANIIAENMVAQIDDEGHQRVLLKEIVSHRIENLML